MKRKVEYFVQRIERLKKTESFQQRLEEIKAENKVHYVITNKGELIPVKDAEENNSHDSMLGIECVHVVILTPETGIKNTLTLLFYAFRFVRNANALKSRFKESYLISHAVYVETCDRIATMQIEKLTLMQKEIDLMIMEQQLKINELEILVGRMNLN